MASKSPAEERIAQMLVEVHRQLAAAERRELRMAADVERLLAGR
jgi:hypothetical protein